PMNCCVPVCPPANVTIECSDSTLPSNPNLGMPTMTNGCGTITYADVTAAGGCADEYTITRTWTSSVAGQICTQTITVQDNAPPTITCPANVTVACTADTSPTGQGSATATDLCDATPTINHTDNIIPGSCLQSYTIQRTWTATDNCMNTSTCTQTIVVTNTPPAITCPADATIQCNTSLDPAVNMALGTA